MRYSWEKRKKIALWNFEHPSTVVLEPKRRIGCYALLSTRWSARLYCWQKAKRSKEFF